MYQTNVCALTVSNGEFHHNCIWIEDKSSRHKWTTAKQVRDLRLNVYRSATVAVDQALVVVRFGTPLKVTKYENVAN